MTESQLEMESDEVETEPSAKRQKLTNGSARPTRKPVFAPYRTIGLVSPTSVPFTAVPLGKTTFQITTSVGRSLQTYDLRHGLNLVFITRPQTPELITASVAWKDRVLAAWGGDDAASERGVWVFKRGKKVNELESPRGQRENIKKLCIFGAWIVGVCDTQLLVWRTANYELHTTLQGVSPVPFTSCVADLPTFVNKIIVGRRDGSAEIWNVLSGKLIYTILPPSTGYGAITALEPTPALSLVAIAFEKGPLLIHDVRTDQTILQLNTTSSVRITSISFRTDGLGAGDDGTTPGVMATASIDTGDITLWDLNDGGRKAGVLRAAHAHPTISTPGGISRIAFLPGQALLVSSGLDNSLKTWVFDEMPFSPIPRIWKGRSGHGAPITKLHFLPSASDGSDDTGKWLMSASQDRSLWGWSLRRDGQSTELSQGAVQSKAKKQGLLSAGYGDSLEDLKCPPISAIACSLNRDGGIGALPGKHPVWKSAGKGKKVSAEVSAMTGWESVITAHENDRKARTWFWGRKKAGRWAFETGDGGNVTAVAMSPCGTFGVIGSKKGGIDMFNMQSGILRQRFPARLTPVQAKQLRLDVQRDNLIEEGEGKKLFYRGQGRHGSAVVGVAIDNLNKTVISAGSDGKIKFWDFRTGLLQHEIDWSMETSIRGIRFHRGSDLAAFSCVDGCIRVVDVSNQRLIRELWPSRPVLPELSNLSIADLAFSSDGHWIAASMGPLILLWDLPTGHLVDALKLRADCTSLAFSPTGEFLATATGDSVGVDVWSNRSIFMPVAQRHIGSEELARIVAGVSQMPTADGGNGENLIAIDAESEEVDDEVALISGDLEPETEDLTSDLLSLSLVPRSRWQNLLHLDLIRQRNRPVEPPKKPDKAPFFLPSLQDRQSASTLSTTRDFEIAELEKEQSRVSKITQDGGRSAFGDILQHANDNHDYKSVVEHLKLLSPAAADIEIRSLSIEGDEMMTFVNSIIWLIQERQDFELGQAWMAVFLKIHGDVIAASDVLRNAVERWHVALKDERRRVQRLTDYCGGMVGYLRAGRV